MWLFIALGAFIVSALCFLWSMFSSNRNTRDATGMVSGASIALAMVIMFVFWISTWDWRTDKDKCADEGNIYIWDQCLNEDQIKIMKEIKIE
ncbi:hypothetical protein PBI_GRAYSON_198 [Rhodococcus phage Grayson]|jgi:hypothetical protein|nr:hypothetical protein PBI_GRAYSON_198 [Rhodococcus phage Grayson]